MNIFIVEDEELAVKKLQKTLNAIDADLKVAGTADSIAAAVEWLLSNPRPDLILMDIELADGQSFEIFNLIKVKSPVIFTTSYDGNLPGGQTRRSADVGIGEGITTDPAAQRIP